MKYTKTQLDRNFDDTLISFREILFDINQVAVGNNEIDIKSSSCHLVEQIDNIMSYREENYSNIGESIDDKR